MNIKKDGIALVGQKGTILVPPEPPIPVEKQNLCYGTAGPGTIAGICVAGKDVVLLPYPGQEHSKIDTVGRRVKGVSITGFEIRGFSGENIALYGAEDASIRKNKLVDGEVYGFLTVGSKNTDVRDNDITSTPTDPSAPYRFRFIAICSDNYEGSTVWHNDIDNYGIALCVQTNGANYQHNHVTNSCYGVFVDPGVKGAIVRHNDIGPTNPKCGTAFGFSSGIVLFGAIDTQVEHNDIKGQTLGASATPTNAGAGIAVLDVPGSPATGNRIIRNEAFDNDVDLANGAASTTNVFKKNKCATSFPDGLCIP